MKIYTVVGTRPELIRLCPWEKEVIFTGQHFSYLMGEQFIKGLLPNHTVYTLADGLDYEDLAVLCTAVKEKIIELGIPDIVLVHGDTRSALAGAIAAQDLKILLAHSEAGVRSDHDTLEQQIRVQIDRMANYNFCPVPQAMDNLKREHIIDGAYFTGDTLYDTFLKDSERHDLVFVTIHRRENIEDKERLLKLLDSLKAYKHVVFPLHPHTRKKIEEFGLMIPDNVTVIEPVDHKTSLKYIADAKLVLTDSGGVEREAFWSGTPCLTARPDTEWSDYTKAFGSGHAGERMYDIIYNRLPYRKV